MKMNEIKLKPCPFCGGGSYCSECGEEGLYYEKYCPNCGAKMKKQR